MFLTKLELSLKVLFFILNIYSAFFSDVTRISLNTEITLSKNFLSWNININICPEFNTMFKFLEFLACFEPLRQN